jgi:hypothetical protein
MMRLQARPRLLVIALAGSLFLLAACGHPSTGLPTTPAGSAPAASQAPLPASSLSPTGAAALVIATDPRFAGIGPQDPTAIGQGSWYVVSPDPVGWQVLVSLGWGDCPAGCLYRHTFIYRVSFAGLVSLVEENGAPWPSPSGLLVGSPAPLGSSLPGPTADAGNPSPGMPPFPIPAVGGPWLVGHVTAGPVCPVERIPPDPACAPRPVAGATIVVLGPDGSEIARTPSGADGSYRVAVPAGNVQVTGAPVSGLLGQPAPIPAIVPAGPGAWVQVDLTYDTGIR